MGNSLSCSIDTDDTYDLNYCSFDTNTYALDNFDLVNEKIKSILYPKPNTPKKNFAELNKLIRTNVFRITNQKENIATCVCEIQPITKTKFEHILIFSHGNGCDIYTFYNYLKLLAVELNVLVVSYDYPTYGLSEGEINEHTCYQALDDVITHYLKLTDKILLVAQSLGTGIVVDYASKNSWTNPIILISPYKSIPKVITNSQLLEGLISKHKYATYQKISNCKCKVKIFHGKTDELIDYHQAVELCNLAPKSFEPVLFDNTGHNDILDKINFSEYKKILNLI